MTLGSVAIIPARGGSKRLPRKNIAELGGRPIISYAIETALRSGLFHKVLVSTEDPEIADIAADVGAEVQRRPYHLADDNTGVVEVCLNSLEYLKQQIDLPDCFCCIYATAAFLNVEDIIKSRKVLFDAPHPNVVVGVSEYPVHPYKAMLDENGYLKPLWPEKVVLKSQAYPRVVASNGTLCWARTSAFIEQRAFYTERMGGYVVPRDRALDLDTEEDLRQARAMWLVTRAGRDIA